MKAALLRLLAKAGLKMGGLQTWIASLIIDKLLVLVKDLAIKSYVALKKFFKEKRQQKKDQRNEETYQDSLQDGVTEADQLDSTSDVLNGRR